MSNDISKLFIKQLPALEQAKFQIIDLQRMKKWYCSKLSIKYYIRSEPIMHWKCNDLWQRSEMTSVDISEEFQSQEEEKTRNWLNRKFWTMCPKGANRLLYTVAVWRLISASFKKIMAGNWQLSAMVYFLPLSSQLLKLAVAPYLF